MAVSLVFLFLTSCLWIMRDNVIVLEGGIEYVITNDVSMGTSLVVNSTTKSATTSKTTTTTTTSGPTADVIENVTFPLPTLNGIQERILDLPSLTSKAVRNNACSDNDENLGKTVLHSRCLITQFISF